MSAHTNLTMIRCDGPFRFSSGCPHGAYEVSDHYTADDLRTQLAEQGWQVGIRHSDMPLADRCPQCREETP